MTRLFDNPYQSKSSNFGRWPKRGGPIEAATDRRQRPTEVRSPEFVLNQSKSKQPDALDDRTNRRKSTGTAVNELVENQSKWEYFCVESATN
jgi:hypothetical protein